MKRSNFLRLAFFVLIAVTMAGSAAAQSTDRDHPTPLQSAELRGELDGGDTQFFYSFVAGPGELTITFDVTASASNAGATIDLFDRNSRPVLSGLFVQATNRGSEREVKSVRLGARQTITMRLTEQAYGSSGSDKGTFLVRLSGPGAPKGESSGNADSHAGERMGLPTSGILRLRMSDGTTQEINLSRVQSASIKP